MKTIIILFLQIILIPIISANFLYKINTDINFSLEEEQQIEVVDDGTGVFFYGEIPPEEFITGNQLASLINLTAGTAHNNSHGWLKFDLDGQTVYVSKRTFRYNLRWDNINARGAMNGTAEVTINNENYKVYSLYTSQWNRLIYRVHQSIPAAQVGNNLANYSNADLGISTGNGHATLTRSNYSTYGKTVRGQGLTSVTWVYSNTVMPQLGWRPMLVKIN